MNRSHQLNISLSKRRWLSPRWAVFTVALLLTSAGLMRAQSPTLPSPEALVELLDVLHDNGAVSQQQYDTLKARMGAPTSMHETTEQASEPQTDQKATPSVNPKIITMMDKGIGIHVGAVDVTVSGEINGFYDHDRVDKSPSAALVAGGLASTGSVDASAVRNGLLPGNFSIAIATHQMGYDVGVTFGFYPGLNSVTGVGGANSAGNAAALGTTGIDFRQQFLTVGKSNLGTFKVGRDIGLFGQEAILNDFSLLGVGSTGGNIAPSNTSLGRIGLGYVYTDFIPQITYTSPSAYGLQAAFGVFTPLDAVNFSGLSGTLTAHDQPQFQAKLTYTSTDKHPVRVKLWTNMVTQSLQSDAASQSLAVGTGAQGTGVDYGGKLTAGGAEFVGYGYNGWGLGTTGLFFDAVAPSGRKRDSYGYYLQGTYIFAHKFTVGGSYGLSHLDLASLEVDPNLVRSNSSEIGGVRYKLTNWVNLVGEYTHTRAAAQTGPVATSDSIAGGSILFF